jgi:glycosyltransferase involved in cell wall biosynthesis
VNRPAVPVADFVGLRARDHDGDGPLRLLSIGRLHWKKGIDDALRVVAELARRDVAVTYRVIGEGAEREKLTYLVDSLGICDRVELLGARSTEEVRAGLAWAQALLLPSLSEGISNAVLEAMAAGLPVVTTDCGGMAEVTTDGVDSFVVGVGDLPAMADRLQALASDADLRARLGAGAAARADADLDISRQVERFVEAYRRVTGSRPAERSSSATSATNRSEDRPSV